MKVMTRESQGERIVTLRDDGAVFDERMMDAMVSALDSIESESEDTSLVLLFEGGESIVGDFPTWERERSREELRYFVRWEDLVSRLCRLKVKTVAGYRGPIGAAAIQLGLVTDLRVGTEDVRLHLGSLCRGPFPGTTWFLLPKFVGLGVARRLLLLGGELGASDALRLGLLDVVGPQITHVIKETLDKMRPLNAEAVYFVRRILDDSYRHERAAAIEQIKAARSKLGSSG